jgi:hypothetical protein
VGPQGPAVVFGIAAVLLAILVFGNAGSERTRLHVARHRWYYRTITVFLILCELVIITAAVDGHHN